jgi:hypothetical protein
VEEGGIAEYLVITVRNMTLDELFECVDYYTNRAEENSDKNDQSMCQPDRLPVDRQGHIRL